MHDLFDEADDDTTHTSEEAAEAEAEGLHSRDHLVSRDAFINLVLSYAESTMVDHHD